MQINENINTVGGEFSGGKINLDVFVGGCIPSTSDNAIIKLICSKSIHIMKCTLGIKFVPLIFVIFYRYENPYFFNFSVPRKVI